MFLKHLTLTDGKLDKTNRNECQCVAVAVCQAYVQFWTRHTCWVCQEPWCRSLPCDGYRCVLVVRCRPCMHLRSSPPVTKIINTSEHVVPVLYRTSVYLSSSPLTFKKYLKT